MREVIFSKYANERSPEFAIRTDILEEADGRRTLRKSACGPQSIPHIRQLALWQQKLEQLFAGTPIQVNRVTASGADYVELEYLAGQDTLEKLLRRLWQDGQKEKACQRMQQYLQLLRKRATQPFRMTEEFARVFGKVDLPEGLFCMAVTDIDLVAENILLSPETDTWHLIDYEWTFAFPIPLHFVIYRIWHYFLHRNLSSEEEDFSAFYRAEGLTEAEIHSYEQMESAFQAYLCQEYVPIRELYASITPGCVFLQEDREGRPGAAQNFPSRLYYGQDAYTEEQTLHSVLKMNEKGQFEVEFSLAGAGAPQMLRWDPLEGRMCRIRLQKVSAEAPLKLRAVNGFSRDGADEFWTRDPAYELEGDLGALQKIRITGELQLLSFSQIENEVGEARCQLEWYKAEYEKLTQELDAIRRTKGFRALEKARRLKNHTQNYARLLLARKGAAGEDNAYQQWFERTAADAQRLAWQQDVQFSYQPKISILVPACRTPGQYLQEMLNSVLAQTYANWELCVAAVDLEPPVLALLQESRAKDARIQVVLLEENRGIAGNTNAAADLAKGDYVTFLDHDDLLAPDALFEVVKALQQEAPDVLYTDEDRVEADGKTHFEPHLKPDFSPDLLRSHNYITHLLVVKKALFDEVGALRAEYDGAQDYDLVLRCTERTEKICHIPKVLYHWRMHADSTAANPESKRYAYEAGRRAVEDHLQRLQLAADVQMMPLWGMNHVRYHIEGEPLVSVIIPNKDHVKDLDRCIRSLLEKSSYRNLELIVVENNSRQKETFAYYRKIRQEFPQVCVIAWKQAFNYAAINNLGARRARGEYLLFLNNDTELLAADSVKEMLGCCMRPEVGCVGAKLLYADNTVQHVGIVLGFGGFGGHVFSRIPQDGTGYMNRAQITQNCSAVTAACMMVRRSVFEQVGGFDESFPVALNDLDLCMKLRAQGYLIVLNPFSLWHHFESKSRGYEDTPQKKERLANEVQRFRARWGSVVDAGDPYYNPNFTLEGAPYTLR